MAEEEKINIPEVDKEFTDLVSNVSQDLVDGMTYLKNVDEEELIEAIESLGEIKEIEDLKGFVLKQIKYLIKYGTIKEKVYLMRELMKYIFPVKRDINMKLKGEIKLVINSNIMGEVDGDRDQLSENGS